MTASSLLPGALCLRILMVVLLCCGMGYASPGEAGTVPRLVFAHYMVCCPRDGHDATVDQLKQEIRDAQQRKIDGFVLNIGSWFQEKNYRKVTERMFAAADQLGSGFLLMFSPDNLSVEETVDFIKSFGKAKSYYRLDGKPVVSSYGGDPKWAAAVRARLKATDIVLVPYWYYAHADLLIRIGPSDRAAYRIFDKALRDAPDLDGYFDFGAADTPKNLAASIRSISQKLKSVGKISMVGVAPYYKGFGRNSRVFEFQGFAGMADQWRAAIESGADWVEIVTWNDWGEATYVAPFGRPTDQDVWDFHWGPLLAHDTYLDASAYYIDWFKSGAKPVIACNRIFYFYRLHPKGETALVDPATGATGRPDGWETLDDRIFITAFLDHPLLAAVSVGETTTKVDLPQGVSHVAVPMRLGGVEIEARDDGRVVARKPLEFAIGADATKGNFNYFAGELEVDRGPSESQCRAPDR